MEKEITRIMDYLGIRRDQAIRIIRQRAELTRRRQSGVSHWLK